MLQIDEDSPDREVKIKEFVLDQFKSGQPFTDASFKPETSSIYDKDEPFPESFQDLEWKRLSEVYPN